MEARTDDDAREPGAPRTVHVTLLEGFRSHAVVITLNDRTVYDAVDVTTDPLTAHAGALALRAANSIARLTVSVMPGPFMAAFDLDVATHPYVGISLVGEGTLAFETSAVPFR
jgi:hypothetical protein